MATVLTKVIANFSTVLATDLAVGGTTATLGTATDKQGNTLPSGKYCFTVNQGKSNEQHFLCDLAGTALTNIEGVSHAGVVTTGALQIARINSPVKLTDFVNLYRIVGLLDGALSLNGSTPLKYDAEPTFTDRKQIVDKGYADDLALAGAPDATTAVKGIVKMSVAPVVAANPIAVGDNDGRLPTQNENDALVGTSGTAVSSSNKLVDAADVAENSSSKIVRRKSDANLTVPTTPTASNDAASKSYVETIEPGCVASDTLQLSLDTERNGASDLYTSGTGNPAKSFRINRTGTIRVKAQIRSTVNNETVTASLFIITPSGTVDTGKTIQNTGASSGSYSGVQAFPDINVQSGDQLEIRVKGTAGFGSGYAWYIKEARVYFDDALLTKAVSITN